MEKLDRVRRHVTLLEPIHAIDAPLLSTLLDAAIQREHLDIVYDSMRSGVTKRRIFPFGVYAAAGAWYCACYDYGCEQHISWRADRVISLIKFPGLACPEPVALDAWQCMAGSAPIWRRALLCSTECDVKRVKES